MKLRENFDCVSFSGMRGIQIIVALLLLSALISTPGHLKAVDQVHVKSFGDSAQVFPSEPAILGAAGNASILREIFAEVQLEFISSSGRQNRRLLHVDDPSDYADRSESSPTDAADSNRSQRSPPPSHPPWRFAPPPPYRGPRHPQETLFPMPQWYVMMPRRYPGPHIPPPMPRQRRTEGLEGIPDMAAPIPLPLSANPKVVQAAIQEAQEEKLAETMLKEQGTEDGVGPAETSHVESSNELSATGPGSNDENSGKEETPQDEGEQEPSSRVSELDATRESKTDKAASSKRLKMVSKLMGALPKLNKNLVSLIEPGDLPAILEKMEELEFSEQKGFTDQLASLALQVDSNSAVQSEDSASAKDTDDHPARSDPEEDGSLDRQSDCSGAACKCKDWVNLVGGDHKRDAPRGCDRICDCPGCEDEQGCAVTNVGFDMKISTSCPFGSYWRCVQCPRDQLYCAKPGWIDKGCYSKRQECDGKFNCRFSRKDESGCLKLDEPRSPKPTEFPLSPEGKLFRKVQGVWRLVCDHGHARATAALAREVCHATVGVQTGPPTISSSPATDLPAGTTFVKIQRGQWIVEDSCPGTLIQVKCSKPPCGFRPAGIGHGMHGGMYGGTASVGYAINDLGFEGGSPESTPGEDGGEGDRIVGGMPSAEMKHPWIVHLRKTTPGGTVSSCTGFILTELWVGTAAHCFSPLKEPNGETVKYQDFHFQVSAGLLRLTSASPSTQIRSGILAVIREDYTDANERPVNDIGLIKVNLPFFFNQYVNALCLPLSANQRAPRAWPCVAAGWGDLKEDGSSPDHLREAVVLVWEPCDALPHVMESKDKMFCAGPRRGGVGFCKGDSGGALVCSYGRLPFLAEGIVSHGEGCARPNSPGVYTRVATYAAWVLETFSKDLEGAFTDPRYKLRACTGMTCDDGRCLTVAEKCNGIPNCPASGEDETQGCIPKKRSAPFP